MQTPIDKAAGSGSVSNGDGVVTDADADADASPADKVCCTHVPAAVRMPCAHEPQNVLQNVQPAMISASENASQHSTNPAWCRLALRTRPARQLGPRAHCKLLLRLLRLVRRLVRLPRTPTARSRVGYPFCRARRYVHPP